MVASQQAESKTKPLLLQEPNPNLSCLLGCDSRWSEVTSFPKRSLEVNTGYSTKDFRFCHGRIWIQAAFWNPWNQGSTLMIFSVTSYIKVVQSCVCPIYFLKKKNYSNLQLPKCLNLVFLFSFCFNNFFVM